MLFFWIPGESPAEALTAQAPEVDVWLTRERERERERERYIYIYIYLFIYSFIYLFIYLFYLFRVEGIGPKLRSQINLRSKATRVL